ncbi:WD repeat-containing protein 53 [Choanephora cucurbitarum]|uniref:WD repeat-containing protein 53 n=1 Tax=Choanephora cucurbitarum TaxID=101091 RepID=A0A1C7NS80_9FUNG|nr:WD repeat-containing protein 53 [Choanephora cucurbitarum]
MMEVLEPLIELKGHKGSIISLEYSESSVIGDHLLASGSEDNTCRIWDLKSTRVAKGIKGFSEPVTSIKFAQKSSLPLIYIASGTKVHTFDLRNESVMLTEPIQTYEFSKDEINQIDVNENNKFMATADDEGVVNVIWSGGMDSKVYEWDFSRGLPTNIYDMSNKEPSAKQMFNPPFVYNMAVSSDGEWIAAGLGDTSIQLLSPPNKKQKKSELQEKRLEDGHNTLVNCLSFVSTTHLLSGSANGQVALWDLNTLEKRAFKTNDSFGRLNSLCVLESDNKDAMLQFAAAGTSQSNQSGALSIFTIKA